MYECKACCNETVIFTLIFGFTAYNTVERATKKKKHQLNKIFVLGGKLGSYVTLL